MPFERRSQAKVSQQPSIRGKFLMQMNARKPRKLRAVCVISPIEQRRQGP